MCSRTVCRAVVLGALTLSACAELGEVLWSQTAGSSVPLERLARAPKPARSHNLRSSSLLPLTAGGVTVRSNASAGGSVWSWVWNGIEFINTFDFGREMQSSLFPGDTKNSNPTEAGDAFSRRADRRGSPLYSLSNRANTQSSRAIPLEFNPQNFGGSPGHPVVWKDVTMGKGLTLNFKNLGPVGQYSTYIKLDIPKSLPKAQVEIPSIYVPGKFNVYWTYDAAKQTLTPVSAQVPDGCATKPPKGYTYKTFGFGGVIVSDGTDVSTAHAMAIYGVNRSEGGSVNYFTLWSLTKVTECKQKPGTGPGDFSTSKLAAVYGPDTVSTGENTYRTWVMTGSINNVTSYMRSLYAARVK
jgi:hypothetical protein